MQKITKIGLILLGCSLFTVAGIYASKKNDETMVKAVELSTATDILTQYDLGQEFLIPEAIISYNGQDYEATSTILYFPNGTPYTSEKLKLSSIGEYILEYQVVVDGKTVSAAKTFNVNSSAYTLGTNSILEYSDSLDRITGSSVGGLHLELADKDIFTYNTPINIFDYDVNTPLLRMHPYSDGGSDTALESLKQVVRLTDCYDVDNYIEFELSWDYSNHITKTAAAYYRASVSNGKSIGIIPVATDAVVSSAIYIGEQRYAVHNGKYGAFSSTYNLTDAGVTVYFDPETNCFYAEDSAKILVSDLDNSELYGDEIFKGFSTGEVYISVLAEEYYTGSVNIDISMMAGMAEKELHLQKVNDNKAPEIVIDIPNTEKIYYIAKNESITLPKAIAYDVNLSGEVSIGIFSYYGTEKCRQHSYKNDIFTPKSEGLYTVVYTARDMFGNVSTKTLTLSCVEKENNKIVSFSVEKLNSLTAGSICELPEYEIFSDNDGVTLSTYYKFMSEDKLVEIVDNAFLVENVGEYEIVYIYKDIFTSYREAYKVNSVASSNVRFDEPIFPKYVIANAPYTFEPVYAYTYEAEKPTKHNAEVYIIADGDTNSIVKVDYANVRIPDCTTVQFKYSYDGISVFSEEIPVVNVGFGKSLKMQQYFVGDFDKTADPNGTYYQSNVTNGTNSLEFVNILSLSTFSFSCIIPQGLGNFEEVDITLTDYYDRDNSVTVSYINKKSTTYMLCGNAQADVGVAFEGFAHKVYYDSRRNTFNDMGGKTLTWSNSFTSDKVLLTVSIRNITGNVKIGILEVGGQIFSNDTADYFKPTMLCEDDGGVKKAGESITIKPAVIIDVLSPYLQSNLTLTVTKPSGGYATSDDNVLLQTGCITDREYVITLVEDGNYRVQYSYTDAGGNMISGGFVAKVSDTQAPTIQLNDGYNESTVVNAKVNTTVSLQGYTVSDDKTATDKLTVKYMVYSPRLEHVFVTDKQFVANYKGVYTVYYYVYDAMGNYSVASYQVNVS